MSENEPQPVNLDQVNLLWGPAGSGKTRRLLQRYRGVLSRSAPGSTIWLAPTSRAAAEIQSLLLGSDLDACFSPGIFTFARFTKWILERSPQPMRPLSGLMKRHLLRQLVEEEQRAGRLEHFGPIAGTSGLLDILCEFIGQMKRLEIWPEQLAAACDQRGVGQKDRELLAIYQAYQQRLLSHNLYDLEGQFWSARDLLRAKRPPLGFEIVVADGFSDFTKTEHDMLQTLAASAGETWISLPLEAEPGREDLFQKPRRTREELWRRYSDLHEEHSARPASVAWPALTHLERTIFSNPRTMQPAADTDRLEILTGSRQIGEIEMIGRTIKRLLIDSTDTLAIRPGDIAVVFRSPQPLAELLSEVFRRLEIPFFLENAPPLGRSPAVVMLVRLLELDAEDWPMHKLLGILGNNYFVPDGIMWDDRAASRAERDIRGLQIPRGRERLLESAAGPHPMTFQARALADALDQLPQLDTLAGHATAWEALAARVGIRKAMRGSVDHAAWKQLHQTLGESEQLAQCLGQDAPRLDRKQARAALVDIVNSQGMGIANEEPGRVRVLSAESVRHLKIPYLFIAGLSEKSFPAAESDQGVYSHAERQRLIESGLPLPSRNDRQTDEMLRFYEVINAATRRLWLSYPALDDSGEPLTPSPYVKEVEQACGATVIARHGQTDLSPVPAREDICSVEAYHVRAVADAMEGKAETLAGFARHRSRSADNVFSGLEFTRSRQNRERFGASEGMLSTAAAESLAAEFPPDRVFSATELERYASCPYQYFLEKVLKVKPLDDVELETDFAQRGQMAHKLLADFHRRVNDASHVPTSPATLSSEDFRRILNEAANEASAGSDGDSLADTLREIDRRMLLAWLEGYREQHANYDKVGDACGHPPRPELFEVSFGRELREEDGPASTAEPLEFHSDGETVRLSGRIDRIDVGQMGRNAVFNILDYKTGEGAKFTEDACQRGTVLQLPVYALAAGELILNDRDALPWQAGYWYVRKGGFKPRQALRMYEQREGRLVPSETWEVVRGQLAKTIVGLVQAMRRGEFPVWNDDPNCTGRCPYSTVCRINHIRSLEKEWRP